MKTLSRWSRNVIFSNRLRIVTVMIGVICIFILLTGTLFIMDALIGGTPFSLKRGGVYSLIISLIFWQCWIISAFSLYTAFSVTVRESRHDYRLLMGGGATIRQVVRSFVAQTITMDMICCIVGIAIGVQLPRLVLTSEQYQHGMLLFFLGEQQTLLLQTLIMPAMMTLACVRFFVYRRPDRQPHVSKRDPMRRMRRRRIFGVGSMIGSLSMSHEKHMRRVFSFSLAVNIACLALSTQVLLTVTNAQMTGTNCDISVSCSYSANDSAFPDQIESALQTCTQKGMVQSYTAWNGPYVMNGAYCILDSSRITDAAHDALTKGTYFKTQDKVSLRKVTGKAAYCYGLDRLIFLDDASFDALAEEIGAKASQNGVLLCDTTQINGQYVQVLQSPYPSKTTLYFLPNFFQIKKAYADFSRKNNIPDDADDLEHTADIGAFLLSGLAKCKKTSIRIIGTLSETMAESYVSAYGLPALLAPMRMYDEMEPILSEPSYNYDGDLRHMELFLDVADHREYENILHEIASECGQREVIKHVFGIGDETEYHYPVDITALRQGAEYSQNRTVYASDHLQAKEDFAAFQLKMPMLFLFLLLLLLLTVIANPVQIVYVRTMAMRWDNAILKSIGLDRRQRIEMLLYESVRVACGGVLRGALLYCVTYPFLNWRVTQTLGYENLREAGNVYTRGVTDWYLFRRCILGTGESFKLMAPLFAFVAAAVFFAFLITGLLMDCKTSDEDLIELLKSNPNQ